MARYGNDTHYRYVPLASPGHIRLLTLHAGKHDAIVECTLSQTTLQDPEKTSYEALSYTWGSDKDQKSLLIDGHVIQVRDNLAFALRRLRRQDQEMFVWIDAICIDQGNIDERSKQVLRMGKIFQQADKVLVWLGDEVNQSDLAMDLAQELSISSFQEKVLANLASGGQQIVEGIRKWRAMASLVERTWFKRRWVIQEIAFAASVLVHCGDRVCAWHELSASISFLQKHGYDIWKVWQNRIDHKIPELAVHRGLETSLQGLLHVFLLLLEMSSREIRGLGLWVAFVISTNSSGFSRASGYRIKGM